MEKSLAIVLRTIDYSNTSLVVTLWTREFGLVKAIARGGRRRGGAFSGSLDLLSLCEVVLIRKKSDSLDLLTRADLIDRFAGLRASLSATYGAMYVAELLAGLTAEHDPHVDLFDATRETLARWSTSDFSQAWLAGFELTLLSELGFVPEFANCIHCRIPIDDGPRVRFSMALGGPTCRQCSAAPGGSVSVSPQALQTLDELQGKDRNLWDESPIPSTILGESRRVLDHVFEHLLGRKPRTRAYLRF